MTLTRRAAIAAAATLAAPARVRAQGSAVKIGMITTLSGPGGYLGQDIRDAFALAIEDGAFGATKIDLVVEDDGLKPAQAKQIANRFIKTDGIKLFTGVVFSNILEAVERFKALEAAGGAAAVEKALKRKRVVLQKKDRTRLPPRA